MICEIARKSLALYLLIKSSASFPAGLGGERDCADGAVDINPYHPPYQHDHHAEKQKGHFDFKQHCLHQQAERLSRLHGLQLLGYVAQDGGESYTGDPAAFQEERQSRD